MVQRGDTLYSIAFRRDMNAKTLARINSIAPPYRIYPGQRLWLSAPRPVPEVAPVRPKASVAAPAPAASPVVVTPLPSVAATPLVPVHPPKPVATADKPAEPPPASTGADDDEAESRGDSSVKVVWRWPLKGKVSRRFMEAGNKGVDIAAKEGAPVGAAAAGKVVYSGEGLIGYGNLIIVKHSDAYLSAYGNNARLLASEGDEVTAGQAIAEAGAAAGKPPAVHFEIRRNGKPVDPMDYLPKR